VSNPSVEPDGQKAGSEGQGAPAPSEQVTVRRDILPMLDVKHVGLTTYDAKDPDTTYSSARGDRGRNHVVPQRAEDS
jgi:hypothetical protein